MADTSPHAEPTVLEQNNAIGAVVPPPENGLFKRRCEICGIALGGLVSEVAGRCSPCFWARKTNSDPADFHQPILEDAAALKYDDGKLPLDLFPFEALEEIAIVLQYGATKYAPHNWRGGFNWSRLFSAMMRHMWAFWKGEDIDPESGHSHLAHAGCCLLFLIAHVKNGLGTDNRYKVTNGPIPSSRS